LAHWDDVEAVRRDKGPMDATWQRLGDAAGAKGIGVNRVRIEPGRLSTPPHSHGRSEEITFVLGGSGLLWQDEQVCEVRAGDTIVQVADHFEHTFKGGPDGLDYLMFGTRHPVELGWLPRSRAIRLGHPWVEGRDDNPWDVEAEIGELAFAEPGERPANVVAIDDVPFDEDGDKVLAATAGSERSGLNWIRREFGKRGCPRTATPASRRRSSCSRVRERSSSGRRRRTRERSQRRTSCGPATSSRGRRRPGSPTRSSPGRTGSPTSPTARGSQTTSSGTRARTRSSSAASG
jgi:uncharacterized cupin superfamily protein